MRRDWRPTPLMLLGYCEAPQPMRKHPDQWISFSAWLSLLHRWTCTIYTRVNPEPSKKVGRKIHYVVDRILQTWLNYRKICSAYIYNNLSTQAHSILITSGPCWLVLTMLPCSITPSTLHQVKRALSQSASPTAMISVVVILSVYYVVSEILIMRGQNVWSVMSCVRARKDTLCQQQHPMIADLQE